MSAPAMTSATCANSVVTEPAGGQRRRADAQPGRHHRRPGVERYGVAVDRDTDGVEPVLGLLAVDGRVTQVHQHQVDVGAAGEHGDPGGL